ncbi:hypothetical protein PIB30_057552 [Stylosanthes scabra]|uniref:Uncharacterized protein n=1 Tax=Stylosanthes scabra TaxID=79078 RepID=A0ABU6XLA9_9FABA|nr:hypothetical protein [Stylosanthes scabra]
MLASRFLQSFPVGLGKTLNFKCRWIIDHSDVKVGAYLDSLHGNIDKQSRFDWLRVKMDEVGGIGPRSILPAPSTLIGSAHPFASEHLAVAAADSSGGSQPKNVPLKMTLQKPICLDGEEGAKEDSVANLKQRKQRHKYLESFPENTVLGEDAAWEHEVNPLDKAFSADFDFWATLDSGLTHSSLRKALGPMPSDQILGTAHQYACKLTACLQLTGKELAAAKDQIVVLTVERDIALTSPRLQVKVDALANQLSGRAPFCLSTIV